MKKLLAIAMIVMSTAAFASSDRDAIVAELNAKSAEGSIFGWYDNCIGTIYSSDGSEYKYDI